MFWSGNTLKMVFVTWRTMTREAIESGHHADSYYEAQARWVQARRVYSAAHNLQLLIRSVCAALA